VKLFFHHVGQKGADEDFKKAVYTDISIETVVNSILISSSRYEEQYKDQA